VGSITALLWMTSMADTDRKAMIIRLSMLTLGIGLPVLSISHSPWLAYPVLAIAGGAVIMQLNTTNTLFQMLAPERLRGRVLAMHIWAVNGISPFGVLVFGWIAMQSRTNPWVHLGRWTVHLPDSGVSLVLKITGGLMLIGSIVAARSKKGLNRLHGRPMSRT
jgi:hypothetical protein